MNLVVNGESRDLPDGMTVGELISEIAGSPRGSAAAIDGHVVPRSTWPDVVLRDGQHVEVLTAVQGG
jgi:sulfur carrier protein